MRPSLYACLTVVVLAAPATAKLPALSDEAKAKAAETAAKTAWTDKVGLYKLCLTMDRVAENYRKTAANAAPPVDVPACADPGPFVPPVAQAVPAVVPAAVAAASAATPLTPIKDKPLEAAEAHSPPGMAVSPPSTKATAAELGTGKPKQ